MYYIAIVFGCCKILFFLSSSCVLMIRSGRSIFVFVCVYVSLPRCWLDLLVQRLQCICSLTLRSWSTTKNALCVCVVVGLVVKINQPKSIFKCFRLCIVAPRWLLCGFELAQFFLWIAETNVSLGALMLSHTYQVQTEHEFSQRIIVIVSNNDNNDQPKHRSSEI